MSIITALIYMIFSSTVFAGNIIDLNVWGQTLSLEQGDSPVSFKFYKPTLFTWPSGEISTLSSSELRVLPETDSIFFMIINEPLNLTLPLSSKQTVQLDCGSYIRDQKVRSRFLSFYENGQLQRGCVVNKSVQVFSKNIELTLTPNSGSIDFYSNGEISYIQAPDSAEFITPEFSVELEPGKEIAFYENRGPRFFAIKKGSSLTTTHPSLGELIFGNPPLATLSMAMSQQGSIAAGFVVNQVKMQIDKDQALIIGEGPFVFGESFAKPLQAWVPYTQIIHSKDGKANFNALGSVQFYPETSTPRWISLDNESTSYLEIQGEQTRIQNNISFYRGFKVRSVFTKKDLTVSLAGHQQFTVNGFVGYSESGNLRLLESARRQFVTFQDSQTPIEVLKGEVLMITETGFVTGFLPSTVNLSP